MKKEQELLVASHKLLELASQYGEAQVSASSSRTSDVKLEKNDYQISTSGDAATIVLTIYRDKRKGSATTNDLSDAGLRDTAEKAATIAATGIRDEMLAFSMPGEVVRLPLSDSKVADVTPAELFDMAESLFTPLMADKEISVDNASVDLRHSAGCLVNTNGVSVSKETTLLTAMAFGMGVRGEQVTSFDYNSLSQRKLDGFTEAAANMLTEFTVNLKSIFNPQKGQSYKGLIILHPEVVAELLLAIVEHHASGDSLKDNLSKWKDMLGQQVASPLLTLWDDPLNTDYLGATGYDGAGTPTVKRTLRDKGVLQYYMESIDSASRRGMKPNGNENGFNVAMMDGDKGGIMELAQKAGVPVLCVRRFSGNQNPIVGDFSGVAKNSHLIIDGAMIPVTETMIAGNSFDLLNNIVAIGESKNFHNQLRCGPVLVDGVSVSVG